MSCSSYCQGLQSCLEPARLVEPPCILRLKLAPPRSNISDTSPAARKSIVPDSGSNSKTTTDDKIEVGGWSFLQSLANNTSENNKEDCEKDKIYIPPNFKRSASMLSEKSLEMCTESLGSETGSDEMALICYPKGNDDATLDKKSKLKETRRMTRSASFPPPLTSISGSTTVQVRSHREGGRLVLKAVSFGSSQTYFQAERIDGRLRLHLMKDCDSSEDEDEEEEVEEEKEEEEVVEIEDEEGEIENWEDGFEENNGNCGGEMGMEKFARPSRCKEGGNRTKSLLNWKPFLVAT